MSHVETPSADEASATAPVLAAAAPAGLDLSGLLTGSRLVLIGGTGFLGKVWLSMLLTHFAGEVEHIWMVVRPRKRKDGSIRQTSEERFWADVATSPVFDPVRERFPGAAYDAFLKKVITPIPGDITEEYAGVPQAIRDEVRGTLTAVVNSSGVVDFNPPLDYALNTNAFGMQNLVALCRDLDVPGGPGLRMLHTSTCYVAGDRTGQVDEVNPLTHPFPKAGDLAVEHWDPSREIAECIDLVDNVRHRANDAFRQSHFLDKAKRNLKRRNEPQRGSALDAELKKVKRDFTDQQLVEWGTERAAYWGWHNIYTYTKSIGEQILASSGVPFAIGRPAVIESALTFPRVGWNEGINTSGPLIFIGVEGIFEGPFRPESVLDVIPVDHVAAGMMAALGELIEDSHQPVYQFGSSDTNPFKITRMIELVGLFKRRHYQAKGKGNPLVNFVHGRLEAHPMEVERYLTRGPRWRGEQVGKLGRQVGKLARGAFRDVLGPVSKGLKSLEKSLTIQARITDQFVPFMATHSYRFSTKNTRSAWSRMPEAMRQVMPFDPELIDWRHYMLEVHCPGIEENVSPLIRDKMKKHAKPLARHDDLWRMIDEIAERHDHAPALLRTHEDGFAKMSFRELRARAEAVAVRLLQAGVKPGDRVVLSARNHPFWVVSYFGILRAKAIAVPIDPQMETTPATSILRSAGPALAILDERSREGLGPACAACEDAVPTVDLLDICARGAVGQLPEYTTDSDAIASILYTSGTTGDPKGVMLSHANFTSMVSSIGRLFPLNENDRLLSVLPLHHAFEFACGLLLPLSMGSRIIYLDEVNGDRLSYGLQEGRVTCMVGVPALWQLLERRIRNELKDRGALVKLGFDSLIDLNLGAGKIVGVDFGRLLFGSVHNRFGGNIRMLISGGAALPKATQDLFVGIGLPLAEGYGLTEAAPVLTASVPKPGSKAGHVGKAIPGVEVRIVDPDEHGVGQVEAFGANLMKGYFNNAAATEATFTEDGWLKTGDLGRFDHKGRLKLVGRAKEVVVTSAGENIYLDDVENTVGEIVHVKEYSLVGVDDTRGGERLAMLAVPDITAGHARASAHDKAREAIDEAMSRLPSVQRPSVVHLVDADLPRTATRKVQRKKVREVLDRIIAATPEQKLVGGGVNDPVLAAIAGVAGVELSEVGLQTRLRDSFGFDSLMYVELSAALEGVGTGRPDTDALSECDTVADVISLVGAPAPEKVDIPDPEPTGPYDVPEWLSDPMKDRMAVVQNFFNGPGLNTKIYGRANVPVNRPAIVVCNHSSHLDMGLVKYALGKYGKKLTALAAKDYFFEGNRLKVTWFTHFTNVEAIERRQGFRASLKQARAVLDRGRTVLLFPEGTRQVDGQLADFKPLVGKLALDSGVDILPIYIDGAYRIMPKGNMMPAGRGVSIHIGPPLEVGQLRRLTDGQKTSLAARQAASLARDAVAALRDGKVLRLNELEPEVVAAPRKVFTPSEVAERVVHSLPSRFRVDEYQKDITWYFSLGGKDGPRWCLMVREDGVTIKAGRPDGSADCVVKTSVDMFRRIVEEGYTPEPAEFMSGAVKTSDLALLLEFRQVFHLSEVQS
jgi:long-chain acyl-CoA synthetase